MDDGLDTDRWNRVEALYHAALERPAADRSAFIRAECADDAALRDEVERLLEVADEAEHFLETRPATPSWIGQTVGPYHVTAFLGAGGMGEVYQATDTRLGRSVALKVLHEAFNTNPDRLRRFEQESRATAALNHPNILAVFDVGSHNGAPFYISELLDGETLRDVLRRGRPPLAQALDHAVQIARGLAAAHDRGIIHRDLKPENVFVTRDGRVKVLDFGVAKLTEPAPLGAMPAGTIHGTLVGTVGYMAPEQVRGESVDGRADIFSLGAVMQEMIAPDAGAALAIARRCLEPAPSARFGSCRELIVALSDELARQNASARQEAPHRRVRAPFAAAAVVGVAVVGTLAAWLASPWGSPASPPRIQSVAVLPLVSLSRSADDEVFADGMTGALITNLAKIRALRVVSRTSVMSYKSTQKSVTQIGRELNVDAVVEGSIERVGSRVRISAQLIRTATDEHLWAEAYDRDARDVLLLQNEVAQSVAREVRVALTPEERAGLTRGRAIDPAAYELYLKARVAWNERTEGSINRAIAYLTQAIEREPDYAAAYAGLADCYLSLGFSFDVGSVAPHEAIPKAKTAATKALALDDTLAEAHTSLAYAKLNYDWDWPGAEAEFRRALTLNPGSADAHHWYAHLLLSSSRFQESLAESDRALSLDQLNPIINAHLGWNHFFSRQYEKAASALGRTLELDPNFGLAYWYRGLAYEQQGRFTAALTEMRKGAALLTGNVVVSGDIGHVHAVAGERQQAERVIAELQATSASRYVSPFEIALIHVGLGDRDRAFEWLEKAFSDRSDLLVYLKVDPRLDPIRSDRRFATLVAKVGLP